MSRSLARAAVPALIVLIVFVVCWPGLWGFWGRDDYFQLAMARLIGTPWPLFTQDHFVAAPGTVFRPLGFFSFWLGAVLFDNSYPAHAAMSIALHAGVAVVVYLLLRRFEISAPIAVLAATLFALHPAAAGTALWWSARFDVLATGLGLLAVLAALAWRDGQHAGHLIGMGLAILAACLSKEIGVIAALAAGLVIVHAAFTGKASGRETVRALLVVVASVLVFFLWRAAVLGTFGSGLLGEAELLATLKSGARSWLVHAPGYLGYGPQLGPALGIAMLVLPAVLLGLLVAAWRAGESAVAAPLLLIACALALALTPALVQAPIVILNARPLSEEMSAVDAAMQSRLYYMSLTGIALLIAALIGLVRHLRLRQAGMALTAIAVVVFGWQSHQQAGRFAERSQEIATVAQAAVTAVKQLELPQRYCHIHFDGIEPPPEWGIFVSMDSIIKALHPRPRQIAHCYVHANYSTFYHLVRGRPEPPDLWPYIPVTKGDGTMARITLGRMSAVYLHRHRDFDFDGAEQVIVLEWRDGRFQPGL